MKLYIAMENMTLLGTCSVFESENLGGTVEICKTREDAIAAVRALIHEQVKCEYDGDPDFTPEDIDRKADEIFELGGVNESPDCWAWDATNRACVWRIVEQEV